MKKSLLFYFLLLFSFSLMAQSTVNIQQINLKDGSQLKGTVLAENQDGSIEFQILGGPIVVIGADTIEERISSEDLAAEDGKVYFDSGKSIRTKGYYATLQFNTNWTNTESINGSFGGMGINTVHGYQFNRFLAVGGGIGLEVLNGPRSDSYAFLPVFLDIRTYPMLSPTGVYGGLKLGYGFSLDQSDQGDSPIGFSQNSFTSGIMGEVTLGLRFASHRRGRFYTELGYRLQKTVSKYRQRDFFENFTFFEDKITFKRFVVNFGWIF